MCEFRMSQSQSNIDFNFVFWDVRGVKRMRSVDVYVFVVVVIRVPTIQLLLAKKTAYVVKNV